MKSKLGMKMMSAAFAAVLAAGSLAGCSTGAAGASAADQASESGTTQSETTAASSSAQAETEAKDAGSYADTITIVWYPNESAEDYDSAREEYGKLIEKATGKKVEQQLTTDYTIAIESIASGTAQIAFMGAEGYVQAKEKSGAVNPLFVNSGSSGTLDDALYYSFLAVNQGDEGEYASGSGYAIDNIAGKRMSFVSNSSTSGFKVPVNTIIKHFSKDSQWANLTVDDLIEGGGDKLFSEVLFGGSHQGSAFNLLSGKADVSAFCDTEIAPYADCTEGTENTAGSIYTIKDDASAPFDTVTGKKFVVITSTPVLNGPFAYNSKTLSPDDVKSIQDLFTSAEVAGNEKIFVPEGSEAVGMFEKADKEQFVLVDDSWYEPIRNME